MKSFRSDPLLAAARLLVTLVMGVAVLVGAALKLKLPVMMLFRDKVAVAIAGELPHDPGTPVMLAIAASIAMVIVMAIMGFRFLLNLRRIIDSVGDGDPFTPVNAARLSAMGWLTIAIEALALPIGAMALWLSHLAKGVHADVELDFPLSGLISALILFILARVFREGTRLRDEVEGTV